MTNDSRSGIKDHPVVSHEEWLSARTAFLAKEKEFTRLRDELSQQRRSRGRRWTSSMSSMGPKGRRRWPSSSKAGASSSSITLCSILSGRKGVRAARSGPTHSMATVFTSITAIRPLWPFPGRPWPKSSRSKREWDGASSGSPRERAISTLTIRHPLPRSKSRVEPYSTIMP